LNHRFCSVRQHNINISNSIITEPPLTPYPSYFPSPKFSFQVCVFFFFFFPPNQKMQVLSACNLWSVGVPTHRRRRRSCVLSRREICFDGMSSVCSHSQHSPNDAVSSIRFAPLRYVSQLFLQIEVSAKKLYWVWAFCACISKVWVFVYARVRFHFQTKGCLVWKSILFPVFKTLHTKKNYTKKRY